MPVTQRGKRRAGERRVRQPLVYIQLLDAAAKRGDERWELMANLHTCVAYVLGVGVRRNSSSSRHNNSNHLLTSWPRNSWLSICFELKTSNAGV